MHRPSARCAWRRRNSRGRWRVAAAVQWYAQGIVSQGKAAELAELTRAGFSWKSSTAARSRLAKSRPKNSPRRSMASSHWVVNASPLILLGKVEQIQLLGPLADKLVVPKAVMREGERQSGRRTHDSDAYGPRAFHRCGRRSRTSQHPELGPRPWRNPSDQSCRDAWRRPSRDRRFGSPALCEVHGGRDHRHSGHHRPGESCRTDRSRWTGCPAIAGNGLYASDDIVHRLLREVGESPVQDRAC